MINNQENMTNKLLQKAK